LIVTRPSIEFFFDIVSPYSYMASLQIDAIGERTGLEVQWRPFLLGGVFKATGNAMPAQVPARGDYLRRDLQRWAKRLDIAFVFPDFFPCNSLVPMRAFGAPSIFVGDELFFGNDRLQMVEEAARVAAG
jgi:2-hydroxychromene-2-carboxylate isomerase